MTLSFGEFGHLFAPVQNFATRIRSDHPYTSQACGYAWSGSADAGNSRWLRGYQRYGDRFEEAYKRCALDARQPDYQGDPEMTWNWVEKYMDDPWNLAGLSREDMAEKTFRIGMEGIVKNRQGTIRFIELFEWDGNVPEEIPDEEVLDCLAAVSLVKHRRWVDRAVNTAVSGWDYNTAMELISEHGRDRIAEVEAALLSRAQGITAEHVLLVLRDRLPMDYVIAMVS